MTVLLAIAITAIVVGACSVALTQQATRSAITRTIGGRPGTDPAGEHRRLLAEATLQRDTARARADLLDMAMNGLTSGVIVADRTGKVLVRNQLARHVSRRAHEQTLVDAATTELLAAAAQGHQVERDVEVYGPPARILFVRAVPIANEGRVVGALAVIEDVTDQHRIDKTRRDFVANLSHELRTPVGAVSLLAEMLVGEDDKGTVEQLTDRLLLETERMSHTIDDLLELSRIESDTQNYDHEIVIQELIDEALARTRVAAEAKQVRVGAMARNEPIVMVGNRDQLLSAIVNLVDNAIKYSDADDSVSLRSRVDDDMLTLTVQDTGRGIPARDVDRIFERFYRVDRSRDAKTGGSGIGLSIVRHVVINHGGTVKVSSFEGDGSTFTLAMPIVPLGTDEHRNSMPTGGEVI